MTFTERDWDIALIVISFCCGVLPGVICLLINLSKPEDKCTICGSITSASPPAPAQVHIHTEQNINVEKPHGTPTGAPIGPTVSPVPQSGDMKPIEFCPNCGSGLNGASNFCELCGEDLRKYK